MDDAAQTWTPRRGSNKEACLAGKGLDGPAGASRAIAHLKSKDARYVKYLNLSHNDLGNGGLQILTDYLCSEEGGRRQFEQIDLTSTGLSHQHALHNLSRLIRSNKVIRVLELQENALGGSEDDLLDFVRAINTSSLRSLNLSANETMSEDFAVILFQNLSSPFIRVLKLNLMGLGARIRQHVANYLSSPVSRSLRRLALNGNNLGSHCLQTFCDVLDNGNYSLTTLEYFGNPFEPGGDTMTKLTNILQFLRRNAHLATVARQEALTLLPFSRLLFFRRPPPNTSLRLVTINGQVLSGGTIDNAGEQFPSFISLPIELQLLILQHLTPHLSFKQRLAIYTWASDPSTLPSISLDGLAAALRHGRPDPILGREEMRERWLELVECDCFQID